MKKPFLLIVGEELYPRKGTVNWVRCFETKKEARRQALIEKAEWYEIVDLREWAE